MSNVITPPLGLSEFAHFFAPQLKSLFLQKCHLFSQPKLNILFYHPPPPAKTHSVPTHTLSCTVLWQVQLGL